MGKFIKALLIVLIVTAFLSACATKLTEGVIYNKEYLPAKTTIIMQPRPGPNGIVTVHPVPMHRSEKYIIYFEQEDKKGSIEVSPTEYEKYNIGDYIKIGDSKNDKEN